MVEVVNSFLENLIQAISIAKKDAKIYYFKPPVIMFGIVFPVFLYFAFSIGRRVPSAMLIPGIAAIITFFGSSSIEAVAFTLERRTGTLDRLLAAPVPFNTIILGKSFASFAFGFILSLIFVITVIPFTGFTIINPILFVIGVAISSLTFAAFGMPLSVYARELPETMMPLNVIRLPMIFVCGVFIPVETMPIPLQIVAYLLPLTYSVDALRQATTGSIIIHTFLIDMVALILFFIALQMLSTRMLKKTIP